MAGRLRPNEWLRSLDRRSDLEPELVFVAIPTNLKARFHFRRDQAQCINLVISPLILSGVFIRWRLGFHRRSLLRPLYLESLILSVHSIFGSVLRAG